MLVTKLSISVTSVSFISENINTIYFKALYSLHLLTLLTFLFLLVFHCTHFLELRFFWILCLQSVLRGEAGHIVAFTLVCFNESHLGHACQLWLALRFAYTIHLFQMWPPTWVIVFILWFKVPLSQLLPEGNPTNPLLLLVSRCARGFWLFSLWQLN